MNLNTGARWPDQRKVREGDKHKLATNNRMTDAQIKETVAALRMNETERAVLLKRALAGDPSARFFLYWKRRGPKWVGRPGGRS